MASRHEFDKVFCTRSTCCDHDFQVFSIAVHGELQATQMFVRIPAPFNGLQMISVTQQKMIQMTVLLIVIHLSPHLWGYLRMPGSGPGRSFEGGPEGKGAECGRASESTGKLDRLGPIGAGVKSSDRKPRTDCRLAGGLKPPKRDARSDSVRMLQRKSPEPTIYRDSGIGMRFHVTRPTRRQKEFYINWSGAYSTQLGCAVATNWDGGHLMPCQCSPSAFISGYLTGLLV